MQSIGNNSATIDARYRVLLIIWFAILMSVGFFVILTLIIPTPQRVRSDTSTISWMLSIIGILLAVISFVTKQKLLGQAVEKQETRLVFTAYIIAFSLSEGTSLFGLLLFMLAPGRTYIYVFAVSVSSMLAHFPRRSHLLAASYKNQ